jgi:hypothetical protein
MSFGSGTLPAAFANGTGRRCSKLAVVAIIILLGLRSTRLAGQTFRGGIAGSVDDSTRASVPDAAVRIEHKATGLTRSQNTPSA